MAKLLKIDEQMQHWCSLLEGEISAWPRVVAKPMFGMTMFYRGKNIFGALPRTRAAGSKRSILIKLPSETVKRARRVSKSGSGWIKFELDAQRDLSGALTLLRQAYDQAKQK